MKARFTLIITTIIFYCSGINAQTTASYSFSNVSNASLTDMSSGATNILVPTSTTGDFVSSITQVGFDFWLMGVRYTTFSVNSNGLMRLGKTAVSNTGNNSFSTTSNLPLLTAFWDDLNSYTISSTSRIRYKITGVAPSRILTVEWKDFIIRNNSSSGSQLSTFQVRLYETTGVFQYVYGRMQTATGSSTVTASIGMSNGNGSNNLIYVNALTPTVTRTAGAGNTLVNSNTVGNITGLNSAADGSRIQYTFTSVTPNAPAANLTFSAIGTSNMTLNWTCAATNELGFAIYRSDDGGATYNFVSQAAANATNSVQSALSPSTTYFWKVYPVTEGALGTSVNGSQATTACVGVPPDNILSYTGSGTTVNWSTAAWSLGHSPTACENAIINFTRTSGGGATYLVNLNVPATVNNLTITGSFGSNNTKTVQLQTNANSLTVLGNLTLSATGGSGANSAANLIASTGSVVTVKGNTIVGQASDTKFTTLGGATTPTVQDPDFYFKGNLTFNDNSAFSYPGTFYFDGGASQTLTNNASTYAVTFGEVEVGKLSATTLTINGAEADNTWAYGGNLNINSNSSLVLPYDAGFNQYLAGSGALNLKANATLKLGDNINGYPGSNFPNGFSAESVDPASTVEYNGGVGIDQAIYDGVIYGNLTITNNSVKYINNDIEIDGNLLVNPTATLGCDNTIYMVGSSVTNNGIIEGIFPTSDFAFYGNAAQTYSGSGVFQGATVGSPFAGLGVDLFNSANVTLNGPIASEKFYLFNGTYINSNQVKIGSATSSLVQRGGAATYPAGNFDSHPVIVSPSNYSIIYYDALSNIPTGFEIPASTNTYQVLSDNINGVTLTSNLTVANELQLNKNIFDLGANTLKVALTITKNAGNMDGDAGTLEMSGAVAQTIPASSFQSNRLKNLIISNSHAASGVTLGGTLDVYRSLTFGGSGLRLNTAGFLTLKSTATETAWLGDVTGKTISGNATVERYIPNHAKAWQFLSVPTTGQTVNAAWQEGQAPLVVGTSNRGTIITNNVAGTGFDIVAGSGPSMKSYNAGAWVGIANTAIPIANQKGYMLMVRGDRSVTAYNQAANATVLRTTGKLYTTGVDAPPVTNVASGNLESVGNPYASAIDLTLLNRSGGVQDVYYVWDPKLTTFPSPYGLGAYQTFTRNGATYDVTPGGGSYPSGVSKTIESGQAFFVRAPFSAGTVTFTEAAKTSGSNDVNKVSLSNNKQLRTNLHVINAGVPVLIDGTLLQYDAGYSNTVNADDAVKLNNSSENLGIMRDGQWLAAERRAMLQKSDTIFYKLGMLRVQQYEFEFIPTGLYQPGLVAYLEDNYLRTSTAINLKENSKISFSIVNVPGSYAADRFRLVFTQKKPAKTPSDIVALDGKGIGNNTVSETQRSKPGVDKTTASIAVYPNPVTDKTMQLQFIGQEAGNYQVQLLNKLGQLVYNGSLQVNTQLETKTIKLDAGTLAGTYQLTVTTSAGARSTQQVVVQ